MDEERKIRREIANSNERRRMQSINAGFHNLRNLLPHHQGEKLSKASILQQTCEYIFSLEQEKTRLLSQNCHLKRLLSESQRDLERMRGEGGATSNSKSSRKRVLKTSNTAKSEKVVSHESNVDNFDVDSNNSKNLMESDEGQESSTNEKVVDILLDEDNKLGLGKENSTVKQSVESCVLVQSPSGSNRSTESSGIKTPQIGHAPKLSSGGVTNLRIQLQPQQLLQPFQVVTKSEEGAASTTSASGSSSVSITSEGAPSCKRSFIVTGAASKQNLNSIVEAIRHLEGDHLFTTQQRASQKVVLPNEASSRVSVSGMSQTESQSIERRTDKAPAFIIVKKIDS